jgi:CHAT domain-containing protein/tetratricopeptide (TPR) repeat protein
MAATRPSSAIRTGSPDSGKWWETQDFKDLTEAGRVRRAAGDFAGLESVYKQGYQRATALGNRTAQISFLSNLGTARMLSLQYAPALEAYLEATALAEQAGDWSALGGIAVNLSMIYQRMGDANAALSALERGKIAMDRRPVPLLYKAQLLMSLRSVRQELRENAAEPRYEEAIDAAREVGDPQGEAAAWDLLATEKIASGNLNDAEAALGEALRLRISYSPRNLRVSYSALGALRLAQAGQADGEERRRRAREGEDFTDRALLSGSGSVSPAAYALFHQRGQIREVLGETELAEEDFSAAMNQTNEWNRAVPAALTLLTGANVALQREVFDSFVEAAARKALRTNSRNAAADGFLALEANRAASLWQSQELAPVWKRKLPLAYWETLGRLSAEEARLLNTSSTSSPESKRLHLALTEMESIAGGGFSVRLAENFRTRNSLSHFQQGLGESDLLLSFYLGKQESYLWAVTRDGIRLHRLPAESVIGEAVTRFRESIVSGQPGGEKLGTDLYQRLFGSLEPADAARKSWLLSLDGALFELPFAALVSGHQSGKPVYVGEGHSLQETPGAMFLTGATTAPGGFLGVGDPVYNLADPRRARDWRPHLLTLNRKDGGELNRLVNSSREVRRSSQSWLSAAQPTQILEGRTAQRDVFLAALNRAPSTIHLATHVLAPAGGSSTTQSQQAFLAFSLDAAGRPGLLSTSEIGMLHVPGALVVMTGCASGAGNVQAGAGLLGLSRAWMMAGARAVVATNWPVPDMDGDLIPAFYRYLRSDSTPEALRRATVDMIHSSTWQASPSYWASFRVTGGGR